MTTITKEKKTFNAKDYDLDFTNDKRVKEFISVMVRGMWRRFHPKHKGEIPELCWDCYVHIMTFRGRSGKSFFERYDDNYTSHGVKMNRMYYIKLGVRNWLIDQERKASRKIQTVSGDSLVGETTTLFQLLEDTTFVDDSSRREMSEVVEHLIARLKAEKEWGPVSETPDGESRLSHYRILKHHVEGYKSKEIADFFSISVNRVNSLVRESVKILCEKYNGRECLKEALAV